jgi:hypothetical protein
MLVRRALLGLSALTLGACGAGDAAESTGTNVAGPGSSGGGASTTVTTTTPTASGGAGQGGGASAQGGAGGQGGTSAQGGAGGATGPTICPCYAGDGPYCASGVKAQAKELGCEVPALVGHAGDLLKCAKGSWSVAKDCTDGCDPTAPGDTDACSLPVCPCFVKVAWCGTGAAKEGLSMSPPCRIPLLPEHDGDILACDGPNWIVKEACPKGCHEAPKGTPDTCNDTSDYYLPWACGAKEKVSQGNNGSSHVGAEKYAWDFAMPRGTPVHASRGGVVAYAEERSPPGSTCYDPSQFLSQCHNKGNFVGVKHADGTVALYLHLSTLGVKVGDAVKRGDVIGKSGNSGYTTGPHTHFQLQNDCGIWFCQSVPVKFADAPNLAQGQTPASGNCP